MIDSSLGPPSGLTFERSLDFLGSYCADYPPEEFIYIDGGLLVMNYRSAGTREANAVRLTIRPGNILDRPRPQFGYILSVVFS